VNILSTNLRWLRSVKSKVFYSEKAMTKERITYTECTDYLRKTSHTAKNISYYVHIFLFFHLHYTWGAQLTNDHPVIFIDNCLESPPCFPPGDGVTKRCHLSWLTNSALVYEPKCRGGGGGCCGVTANEFTCAHGAQINFCDLTP
jgi:hypothetical protein